MSAAVLGEPPECEGVGQRLLPSAHSGGPAAPAYMSRTAMTTDLGRGGGPGTWAVRTTGGDGGSGADAHSVICRSKRSPGRYRLAGQHDPPGPDRNAPEAALAMILPGWQDVILWPPGSADGNASRRRPGHSGAALRPCAAGPGGPSRPGRAPGRVGSAGELRSCPQ